MKHISQCLEEFRLEYLTKKNYICPMENHKLDVSDEGSEGVVISITLQPDLTLEQKRLAWENTCKASELPIDEPEKEYH